MERILITGGSGLLGSNLIKNIDVKRYKVLAPSSDQMDINNKQAVNYFFEKNKIDLCIHAAALTNVPKIQKEFKIMRDALYTNIVGTVNILDSCITRDIKLCFISTDHVFDGLRGNYSKDDLINPLSKYAKTKASAELAVRVYENSLVIRTSFFGNDFPYEKAFIDQWSSKDYIDIMAPKILKECLSDKKGISHVFSKRRSLYEIAKIKNKKIKKISVKDFDNNLPLPIDTSLL